MPITEKLAAHRNDIITKYTNGASASSIGREYGVTTTTVTRILKGSGVMPALGRGAATKRRDESEIIAAFQNGMTPTAIRVTFRVSKSGLYSILNRCGVELRGHTDRFITDAQKTVIAQAREISAHCNPSEQMFRDILESRGIKTRAQVAIAGGNVDFVLPDFSIAVEICFRGTFNKYIANGWLAQRIRDCANRGWHTYVLGAADSGGFTDHAIEDVIAWCKFLDRSPPSRRQYRVVWGGTELLAAGCSDDDKFTLVNARGYRNKVANRKGLS